MTSLSETSLLAGASGQSTGYTIDQSIRFNTADTAYMKRTPSSAGNQKTWTFSVWFKRGTNHIENGDQYSHLLGTRTASTANFFLLDLNSDDIFIQAYTSSSQTIRVHTNRKYRDTNAWYHLVLRVDTTQNIAGDRIRVYINGEQQTDFESNTQPSKDYDTHINGTSLEQAIGTYTGDGSTDYPFDGYMAEIIMADGYSYGPEQFGEIKTNTGIWIPKEFSGSYGTNGFYITGADSGDLGNDESGNNNDFTEVNLASNDKRADTPTNNFMTWNTAANYAHGATMTYRNGALDVVQASGAWGSCQGNMAIPASGKWAFAFQYVNSVGGSNYPMMGLIDSRSQVVQDAVQLPYQSGSPADSMIFIGLTGAGVSQQNVFKGGNGSTTQTHIWTHANLTTKETQVFINGDDKELTIYQNDALRVDAYDISFLTFPVFLSASVYAYTDLRILNEPGTEYTPAISGYSAINTVNLGEAS